MFDEWRTLAQQRVQGAESFGFFDQPVMHGACAWLAQPARRVMEHVALVVGDRHAEGHDQCAPLQLVVEQGAPGNGHTDAGDGGLDGQVVAIEGVSTSHIQAAGADAFEVELPFGIFRAATPGGDVVQ